MTMGNIGEQRCSSMLLILCSAWTKRWHLTSDLPFDKKKKDRQTDPNQFRKKTKVLDISLNVNNETRHKFG